MSVDTNRLDLQRRAEGHGDRYREMLERAHALLPRLRERAVRTEELRRLPPETERELHDAGLFRILQPARVGGSELDYVALVDCADVVAQADAITGCLACSTRARRT
jgi:3-hydroxy-9,10-secoandrosta-1,3,5(10)-triene-9,17-dione monooxygenase